jgi:hypothetical protein
MTPFREEDDILNLKATSTMKVKYSHFQDIGKITRLMKKGLMSYQMVLNIKETGKMISKRVRVKRFYQMEPSTLDSLKMERRTDKEQSNGLMDHRLKANSLIAPSTAAEHINGQMEEVIKEIGSMGKCKEKVNLVGLMESSTKESTGMIKKMDLVSTSGMVNHMKGLG